MDVLNDPDFLRRDNANLLKEVHTLRLQTSLLRDRNKELERNLMERLGDTVPHDKGIRNSVTTDIKADGWTLPKLRLDTNVPSAVEKRNSQGRKHRPETSWFDDSPTQTQVPVHPPTPPPPPAPPPPTAPPPTAPAAPTAPTEAKDDHSTDHAYHIPEINGINIRGSRLIGEAPRPTPKNSAEELPADAQQVPTVTPPSPDPSEGRGIPLPSLYSVTPPVTGVAVPHVSLSLLELKLIRKDSYDSPAAIASFMHRLTRKEHVPQSTYRAAFTAAFLDLIPQLGPLSPEWVAFLHDFPSRIPASKRDSLVTIPMRESGVTILIGGGVIAKPADSTGNSHREGPAPGPALQSPITVNTTHTRRRSRSVDGYDLNRQSYLSVAGMGHNYVMSIKKTPTSASTGLSPCERDAWVLLLALAYAAYPRSKVAKRLRMLPVTVKLQMIAWLPPTVNVYDNMCFASMTVDETLGQLWDAKKEILRLKHGWP